MYSHHKVTSSATNNATTTVTVVNATPSPTSATSLVELLASLGRLSFLAVRLFTRYRTCSSIPGLNGTTSATDLLSALIKLGPQPVNNGATEVQGGANGGCAARVATGGNAFAGNGGAAGNDGKGGNGGNASGGNATAGNDGITGDISDFGNSGVNSGTINASTIDISNPKV